MRSSFKIKLNLFQAIGIVALFFAVGFSGCDGISTKGGTSSCTGASAHLNIYDTRFERVCGCTEGTGVFTASGTLNCTVPFGTTVYFYFVAINSPHQISTSIGTTQPVYPTDTVKTAALPMNQVGTINFVDSANGMTGTFTVTP